MFELKLHKKIFQFDFQNINDLLNNNSDSSYIIRWKLDENDYPYYINQNRKTIYLIDKIMKKECQGNINFLDGNKYNYQKSNLQLVILEDEVNDLEEPKDVEILEPGNFVTIANGKFSNQKRNMYWKVSNNDDIFYMMSCRNTDKKISFIKFSIDSLQKVLDVYKNIRHIWHIGQNGYPKVSYFDENKIRINRYLHQHLMDYYGHGLSNKKETIDHINRDKLDNRMDNLRLLNQSEQNMNTGKRNRKHNAKPLPDGLTQEDLPKWVVYYREKIYPENGKYRDFFKIEKCPYSEKVIYSSKSNKVSIRDKLKEIKEKLDQLTNGTYEKEKKELPLGMYLKDNCMIFDYRDKEADIRYNLKMKCKNNLNEEENLKLFKEKVKNKYEDFDLF